MPVRSAFASTEFNLRKSLESWALTLLLMLLAINSLHAQTPTTGSQSQISSQTNCHAAEPEVDGNNDVKDLRRYKDTIVDLLQRQKFDDLDCIAHAARVNKTRFPGGTWKLTIIYAALESPKVHATQQDWIDYLAPLEHWVEADPTSVTARIALADAYVSYAWDARGEGLANTVSENGWQLFGERLEKARQMLDEASHLPEKCPHWYVVMQHIAQGQGWDMNDENALFKRALAFEPAYYSFYRVQAFLLLPRWYGVEGDASGFAMDTADRMKGKESDVLYFQIAAKLSCACDEPEVSRMSWDRIQRGFEASEELYGTSMLNLNEFALLASTFNDSFVADAAFKRIGEQWDEGVWETFQYFSGNRDFAAQIAPHLAKSRAQVADATANRQSPEGALYYQKVAKKFSTLIERCIQTADNNEKFDFMLLVASNGAPAGNWTSRPSNMMLCLQKQLIVAEVKKQAMFPRPPHDSYWLKMEVDPSVYKARTLN
jgi:hypothetical protein